MIHKFSFLSSILLLSIFADFTSSAAVESDDVVKTRQVRAADTTGTNCGRSKYADAGTMIVGGKNARPNEFPWQVSLRLNGQHICGGSIINWPKQAILTAAHCMFDGKCLPIQARYLTVVVGDHQRSAPSSIRQIFKVSSYYAHQSYICSSTSNRNDIALITLSSTITFTANIAPVCLPSSGDEQFIGRTAYVSGWGASRVGGTATDILMFTQLTIPTNSYCSNELAQYLNIYPDMICTRDNSGNRQRDSCQGDSGGPVVVKDSSGTFTLVGLVSTGVGCARGYPGVNARVSSHLDWIKSGGCFAGSSTVRTRSGLQVAMSDLRVGDEVLTAVESTDGEAAQLSYAPVIAFLHRDVDQSAEFVEIVTAATHKLTLTASHLIYIAPRNSSAAAPRMMFAADAAVGDFVFAAADETETATRDEIVSIRVVQLSDGVYAPLTTSGTIVVDGVTCSCYAEFSSHRIAHAVMLPLRVYHYMKTALLGTSSDVAHSEGFGVFAGCNVDHGIHWYAGMLRGVVNSVSFL